MWLAIDWFSFWKIRAGSSCEMSEPKRTRKVREPWAMTGAPKAAPSVIPVAPASSARRLSAGEVLNSLIVLFSPFIAVVDGRVRRPKFLWPVARQARPGLFHALVEFSEARRKFGWRHDGLRWRHGVAAS
jgi:hypothetical protein